MRTPNFIVTGTDVLVRDIKGMEHFYKKFIVNTKRNFVILFSGHFVLSDASKPDPRKLLIEGINKTVNRSDPLIEVSRKVLQLIAKTYSQKDTVDLQMQFCGFDGNIPRIYLVMTKENPLKDLRSCLTGAQRVMDYARTTEGQRQICLLKSLIPEKEILSQKVRQFMDNVIKYENERAKESGEKPMTGGGVNIVTVDPKTLFWSQPRFDSKDDPYQIHLST